MENVLEKLLNTLEAGQGGYILGLAIIIFLIVIAVLGALFFLIRFALTRKVNLRLGDKGIQLNGASGDSDQGNNSQQDQATVSNTESNITRLTSTISTVITESIETGYLNCKKRQDLFDAQMTNINENFNMLQTYILEDYQNKFSGTNLEMARIVLNYCMDKVIVEKLRHICILDRLAEKKLDDLIEVHRFFIDRAFLTVKQDLQKTLKQPKNDANTFIDEALIKAVELHEDEFRKMIVESLEMMHADAKAFLEEVNQNNKVLNTKINKTIKTYLGSISETDLPATWIEQNVSTPPVDILGEM